MAINKKGQAALEYLSTYGWLLIIIVIVAAALYALGIFNPATYQGKTCTGFTTGLTYAEHKFSPGGAFSVVLMNGVGKTVSNVTNVNITLASGTSVSATPSPAVSNWAPGGKQTLTITGPDPGTTGSSYTATVTVTYNTADVTGHKQSGTCTGTVE